MKRPLCMVCLIFCLLWGFIQSMINIYFLPYKSGTFVYIQGRIYEEEKSRSGVRLYLNHVYVQADNSENPKEFQQFPEKIKIYLTGDQEYRVGEVILVRGYLETFPTATNPGQFDQRKYEVSFDIRYQLKKAKIMKRSQKVSFVDYQVSEFRNKLQKIYEECGGKQAGTLISMLLGQRSYMAKDKKELFQRNGISHILAISALHISFIGMMLFKTLEKCKINWNANLILTFLLLGMYGKMTGMSPSTMRAIIMLFLMLFAKRIGRTYDMPTAMAFALLIIVIVNPGVFLYSGFQLSFFCVLGLCSGMREILLSFVSVHKQFTGIFLKILDGLLSSTSITIFTLPIILKNYYSFSTYSILLNLLIIPMMSIVMFCGVTGGLIGFLSKDLATVVLIPARIVLFIYEWLCNMTDRLPFNMLIIGEPALWQILLYYFFLVILIVFYYGGMEKRYHENIVFRRLSFVKQTEKEKKTGEKENDKEGKNRGNIYLKRSRISICLLLAVFILFIPNQIRKNTRQNITFLDVGQGDCACVQIKGFVALVDGGSSSVNQLSKYRLEPFLKSQGISKVDAVFISHGDVDHVNGIVELIGREKESGIEIETIYLTEDVRSHKEEYKDILAAAHISDTEIKGMKYGDYLIDKNYKITCLGPKEVKDGDINDSSMVLYLETKNKTVLFTGDISEKMESEIVNGVTKMNKEKSIDILKVAHHGSKYSTSEAFLKDLNFKNAVISCGEDNGYGHPHKETLERLNVAGVNVYRTDESGAIEFKLKGGSRMISE